MDNKPNKVKAVIWCCLIPLFFLFEIVLALAEYNWGWKYHWANVMTYWLGGDHTNEGRVYDKEDNQIYPKLEDKQCWCSARSENECVC